MAKPTAPTELGGSKVLFGVDPTAVTPAAFAPSAVQSTTTGEASYPAGWLGIASHRAGDTDTQPGGFTGLATAAAPVLLVAGVESTTVRSLQVTDVGGAKALKVDVVQTVGSAGGTSSSFGAAFPAAGTAGGFSDGTNMQGARVFDVDTGAGFQYVLGAVLRQSASGGSVEAGTATDPLRVDPTGATTQPVSGTVTANAGTGPWPVTDNGGSLTIDAPVGTPANVQVGDGTTTATVRNLAANDALNVAIVDAAGDQIVTFGGGVQYTEGAVDGTITGTAIVWEADNGTNTLQTVNVNNPLPVQFSNGTSLVQAADPTANALRTIIRDGAGDSCMDDANNALRVNIIAGAGSGGTASTDDSAFTAGGGSGTPMMGFATTDVVDAGDVGVVAMTVTRALHATLRDSTGDSVMDDTNDAVRVNIVAGAGSGGTAMTDDSAFTAGTTSVTPAAGFYAATRDLVDAGDAGALAMTQRRALDTVPDSYVTTANSSTTPLASLATFTGVWERIEEYAEVAVTIYTDQDWQLDVQWSQDGGTTTHFSEGTVSGVLGAFTYRTTFWRRRAAYVRILLTNTDASPQTGLDLRTHYNVHPSVVATDVTDTATNTGSIDTNLALVIYSDEDALGATPVGLLALGKDSANAAQSLATDTTGRLRVVNDGTFAAQVSGTVTANIGTSGALALDATAGETHVQDAGALATFANLIAVTDGSSAQFVKGDVNGRIETVLYDGGASAAIASATSAPVGTERGLITRNIPSGNQTVSGTVAATQSGAWTVGLDAGTNNIGDVDVLTVPAPLNVTGAGTQATAQRVTLASDSPGTGTRIEGSALSAGNIITVLGGIGSATGNAEFLWTYDMETGVGLEHSLGVSLRKAASGGSVPYGTVTDPFNIQIGDGTNTATIRNLAANDALNVAIVDGSGGHITSFGGGTQYTEDDPAAANPVGTAPILVRSDTPATQVSADGDNVAQRGTNYGAAYVQVVTSSGAFVDSFSGSGGTSSVDDSAFTIAVGSGTPIMGLAASDSVDTGDVGVLRMTNDRALVANLEKIGGNNINASDGAADAKSTTFTGPIAQCFTYGFNGTSWDRLRSDTTNGLDVDVTRVQGTVTVSGTVTADAGTGFASLAVTGNGTATGAQRVTIASDSTGTVAVTGTVTSNAGTGTRTVAGVVADDGVASGNPVQIGLVARTTDRTAVAAGDVVYAMGDTLGKTVTSPYATTDRMTRGALTKSTTGAADLIAAPGAGLRLYITSISASNTSGTAVRVDFLDGAAVVASFFIAASGGGVSHTMPTPIRVAANTAFRVDLGAAVTDVRFSAQGYIAGN